MSKQSDLVNLYESYCKCGHALYHHLHPHSRNGMVHIGFCDAGLIAGTKRVRQCKCSEYKAADPLTLCELIENHLKEKASDNA